MKRIASATLAVALLVACNGEDTSSPRSSRDTTPQNTTGPVAVVAGEFRQVGGPAPGLDEPLAGRIEAHRETRDGPIAGTAESGKDGIFSMNLAPGTYVFVGSTPRVQGAACLATATLHEGENAPVSVTCNLR